MKMSGESRKITVLVTNVKFWRVYEDKKIFIDTFDTGV